jgi:serine/threonine-protein kinase
VALEVGRTFDRYTIEAVLGEGGMGRVYRAYDPRLHRRVALKVLALEDSPGTSTSGGAGSNPSHPSDGAARMLREARAAAALDHPNAVAIFDVGDVDGDPFIAMELIEGRSLRAYIGRPEVGWDRRLRWLADVARALAAAHKRGLVHRDIKPENVIVREEDGVVKVLDFGIARRPDAPVDPTGATQHVGLETLTSKGLVVGTPRYMSPEQIRGDAIDGRSDQFAWGVLAYELLGGQAPWKRADDSLAAVAAVLTTDPEPLDVEGLPDVVRHAILRTLSKSVDARYTTMDLLLRVIEPFVTGSASDVNGPTGDRTVPMPAAPHPTETNATKTPATPSGDPRQIVQGEKKLARGKRRWAALSIGAVGLAIAIGGGSLAVRRHVTSTKPPTSVMDVAPRATAMTDLPDPPTQSRDALAAYRAAMQAYRDGLGGVDARLRRAIELDPNLAGAHMRLSLLQYQTSPTEARESYRRAFELRGALSERDQAFLASLEPFVGGQQKASRATQMAVLVARYPLDAELWYQLGTAHGDDWELDLELKAHERAIELDPSFARAWWQRGQTAAYIGRLDEARSSLETCLRISPTATSCTWNLICLDEIDGACAKVEAEARSWIIADGHDPLGHFAVAAALVARGRPRESVEEALRLKELLETDAERPKSEAVDVIQMGVLSGDFGAVVRAATKLEQLVGAALVETEHKAAARALVETFLETGRVAEAAKYAEAYLRRREAWLPEPFLEDFALADDVSPLMWSALRAAGKLDGAEVLRRRDAWLARWPNRLDGFKWMHGNAALVVNPEEAKKELAARGELGIPRYTPKTLANAQVGRILLLAGRVDEALPYLERAASSCLALEQPFMHTRANLWLGRAREAKHDAAGACAAYRIVVERWGRAKPRSLSADEARARMKSLHCD